MKKSVKVLIVILVTLVGLNSTTWLDVSANTDAEFRANMDSYYSLCRRTNLSLAEQEVCDAFSVWLGSYRQEQESNSAQARAEIRNIQGQLEILGAYIQSLEAEIRTLELEISMLEARILELEANIRMRENQIREMLFSTQEYIVNDTFLQFIMGAETYDAMFRRRASVDEINTYILEVIASLEADKARLEEDKKQLDVSKAELDKKKAEAEAQRAEFKRQESDWQARLQAASSASAASSQMLRDISSARNVVSSAGWRKLSDGGRITAGTWNYPASFGGGLHLGIDIGLPIGSTVYAPANGIVLDMIDGCPTIGFLGSSCGSGFGNHIVIAVNVSGVSYILILAHMQNGFSNILGWPSSRLITFQQGDVIARTGSSGNSSGGHIHAEVIHKGSMSLADIGSEYARTGDRSGGAGFGRNGRRCEASSPPCRVRPENIFGGFY